MAEHRHMWRVWQRSMDPERFVFIDEVGAAMKMVRHYGWGRLSERVVAAAPHGHWRTTKFVAGLRSTGLVAPLLLDRPLNGPAILAYVEQLLARTLRRGDGQAAGKPRLSRMAVLSRKPSSVFGGAPPLPIHSPV